MPGQGRRIGFPQPSPIPSSPPASIREPARRITIRGILPGLLLLGIPHVASAQFTITRVSSSNFYNDTNNNPVLTCAYAGYRITNTSATTYPDVWAGIGNFTGGVVQLAPTEGGTTHHGVMAPGQSR